jgi:uncharacterized protein with von Willebrand factor type A (vWA) domain
MFFLHNLVVFERLLRRAGLDVHTGRLIDLTRALAEIDIANREEVYHACRTLMLHRREDLATFDRVFAAFWQATAGEASSAESPLRQPSKTAIEEPGLRLEQEDDRESSTADADNPDDSDDDESRAWSDAARLTHKDFAEFTEEEIQLARVAFHRLRWVPDLRRTRRWVPGRGHRLDMRRALARSLRTGGDVVTFPRERRRLRPRSLVLLCDVSGSMESYSRLLLHFAHAMVRQHTRVEVFLFATRLTRITPELRTRSVDAAVSAVAHSVQDWSSGTRIGEALRHLHQRWSRRVLVRQPVVLLVSDGWDRGDPSVMRDEVRRLQRSSHRLIWLSPLVGTAGYAPLTRGLQAALPFVDDFLPGRTISNLADLANRLNEISH